MERLYRFVVGEVGIYAAVDRDCPRDDIRREAKPDGSWLPKRGADFPGAVSLWKEYGLKRYIGSGLAEWHASVVKSPVHVLVAESLENALYEDEYQVICNPDNVKEIERISLDHFLKL
jgi:hypothetical protein